MMTNKIVSLVCIGVLAMALHSCTKEVILDLKEDIRLVVDGTIVLDRTHPSEEQDHTISVKMSAPYLSPDPLQVINDATVTVKDNFNNTYNFSFTLEDSLYHAKFAPIPGATYTLTIRLSSGETYQAVDNMPATTASIKQLKMENLTVNSRGSGATGPVQKMQPVLIFQDPADEKNFYDYKVTNNGYKLSAKERVYFRTPVLADNDFNGQETSRGLIYDYSFNSNDLVKVSLLSISRENFEFQDAVNKLESSGSGNSLSDPPKPAILGNIGNLSNSDKPGLGFFATVSLTLDSAFVP